MPVSGKGEDRQVTLDDGLPIRFIDMNDQSCATRRRTVMRNRIVIFTDDNHPRRERAGGRCLIAAIHPCGSPGYP